MDDLISRQAAIAEAQFIHGRFDDKYISESRLRAIPAADPVKHGKWIESEIQDPRDLENDNRLYICSNCGHSDLHAVAQEVPYCWWCGAKMDGEV